MKSRLLVIAAVVMLALVGTDAARAQGTIAPSSQFGIGVNTGGFQLQYALSPSLQLGLTTTIGSMSVDSVSATAYGLAPYVRFLLEGTVNPYFEVGLQYAAADVGTGGIGLTADGVAIFASFGLEYFINRNVGIFAGANLLQFELADDPEPSVITFGYFQPRMGLEWYFTP